jgi:hypothetical protein
VCARAREGLICRALALQARDCVGFGFATQCGDVLLNRKKSIASDAEAILV